MIWTPSEALYKDGQYYTDIFFCLQPRLVEGHWVWLEKVARKRKWLGYESGGGHWWSNETTYHLTQAQKIRLGIKW